jgi:pectate lyase
MDDNLLIWNGSHDILIDHCSVSDGGDENLSITEGAHDVTVSWCMLGDSRNSHTLKSKLPSCIFELRTG